MNLAIKKTQFSATVMLLALSTCAQANPVSIAHLPIDETVAQLAVDEETISFNALVLDRRDIDSASLIDPGMPLARQQADGRIARQGFGLPHWGGERERFDIAVYASLLAMLIFAIAFSLRQLALENLNRGMERIVVRVHGGARRSHRRRRRPSSSAKYATLAHYMNGSRAGRRRRRRSARPHQQTRTSYSQHCERAATTSTTQRPSRDRIVSEVIITNGFAADHRDLALAT